MQKDFNYYNNKVLDFYDKKIFRVRLKVTKYFLMIVGPFSLLWGFFDFIQLLGDRVAPEHIADKESDVIIRIGTGAVLILIWFIFFVILDKDKSETYRQ
ncbi:MAG: hypothetical protein HYT15_01320 [Candidatus Magasanikbacteria bacterium]|nr:hypothetical protein [Candidatus Magasanikbacteria bacterium]